MGCSAVDSNARNGLRFTVFVVIKECDFSTGISDAGGVDAGTKGVLEGDVDVTIFVQLIASGVGLVQWVQQGGLQRPHFDKLFAWSQLIAAAVLHAVGEVAERKRAGSERTCEGVAEGVVIQLCGHCRDLNIRGSSAVQGQFLVVVED